MRPSLPSTFLKSARLLGSMSSAAAPTDPATAKRIFAPGTEHSGSQAEQYSKGSLERSHLADSPFDQFSAWFSLAQQEGVHQPETVCLSTADRESGRVSSRYVYLKEMDDRGWVIYSNWGTSRKARDITSNPYASLAFWWREQERQVRVEGVVERLSKEASQRYFDTRIRESRLGAWASEQSEVLRDRAELEQRVQEVERKFDGVDQVPVPDFWGGLRVKPERVEFWQGRVGRLHDRFVFERQSDTSQWTVARLSP